MKSTWFSDRKRYEFAKCLQASDYSRHGWDLFSNWLQVASGSLRQACHVFTHGEQDEAIEANVIKFQKQSKDPKALAQAFAILVEGLEAKPDDFLGSVLMEWGQNDVQFKGQCFTPMSVCHMMANMTFGDMKPNPDHRIMLSEPACGGGAMVIASSIVLKENGFLPWNYFWHCVDVDWRMYAACYIQASLLGIPADVFHGNTISMEQFEASRTIAGVMHPPRRKQFDEPVQEAMELCRAVDDVFVAEPVTIPGLSPQNDNTFDGPSISDVAKGTYQQLSLF